VAFGLSAYKSNIGLNHSAAAKYKTRKENFEMSLVIPCGSGKYTYIIFVPSDLRRRVSYAIRGTRAHRRFDIVKKARGRDFLAAGALRTDDVVAVLGFGVKVRARI
jgi:hypothetical protein